MLKNLINIFYFISPKILSDYISYIGGFRHFKISFSQFGEDLILLKYLKYKGIEKGKYLDIEGKDFEVIKSSNLNIINPEKILIEDNHEFSIK